MGDTCTLELLWVRITMLAIALYLLLRPIYEDEVLVSTLEQMVENLMRTDPQALIILGGDFNKL